jgi:hypothetical protein
VSKFDDTRRSLLVGPTRRFRPLDATKQLLVAEFDALRSEGALTTAALARSVLTVP